MAIDLQQFLKALEWTEESAESISKLAEQLKEVVEFLAGQADKGAVQSPLGAHDLQKSPAVADMDGYRDLAKVWSHLPKETRQELLDPIRHENKGNVTAIIAACVSQVIMLASMAVPVANLGITLGTILKNQQKTFQLLEKMNNRLEDIQKRIDETVMKEARLAMVHLTDAANMSRAENRRDSLGNAGRYFASLIALDPGETTSGVSATVQNKSLICLGYWGRHLVLSMQGETRYAMIQVYECVQKYPLEGTMVFPPEYFFKDYKTMIDYAKQNEILARKDLKNAQKSNQLSNVDRGFSLVGGAMLGLAGVAIALFGGGGSAINAGVQMMRVGYEGVNEAGKLPTSPFDTINPLRRAESMADAQRRLVTEVVGECAARLQLLGKISVDDLREIIITV